MYIHFDNTNKRAVLLFSNLRHINLYIRHYIKDHFMKIDIHQHFLDIINKFAPILPSFDREPTANEL